MLCARTAPQSEDCVRVRSLRLGASPLRCVPLRRRYSARGARRTDGRLPGSSSAPRRVPPVGAVFARACAPPGSVGIPPVAIRRAFAAHPASRSVRVACLLLAVLRVLCAIGPAVLLRCRRETPAPTHRHYIRFAPSWRKTLAEAAPRRFALVECGDSPYRRRDGGFPSQGSRACVLPV